MVELEKVIPVKINSLRDLVRLAATISAPHQGMMYMLKFRERDGRVVLGVLGVFRDYYKLYGVPMFYYYICEGEEAERIWESNYIIISTSDENISFSKTPRPGLSLPMIALAEKPAIIPDLS